MTIAHYGSSAAINGSSVGMGATSSSPVSPSEVDNDNDKTLYKLPGELDEFWGIVLEEID